MECRSAMWEIFDEYPPQILYQECVHTPVLNRQGRGKTCLHVFSFRKWDCPKTFFQDERVRPPPPAPPDFPKRGGGGDPSWPPLIAMMLPCTPRHGHPSPPKDSRGRCSIPRRRRRSSTHPATIPVRGLHYGEDSTPRDPTLENTTFLVDMREICPPLHM